MASLPLLIDSPRRWRPLHGLAWFVTLVGMALLVVSRGHYTIDITISYYICTRIFWNYHTFAAFTARRVSKCGCEVVSVLQLPSPDIHASKVWWFPLFYFMEKNVIKPVPKE